MEGFSIRPATEDDVAPVAAIEKAVHTAPWSEQGFSAELKKSFAHFWVLTDDETDTLVAGYIVFGIMDKECRILNVAVALPFRGMGVGQQLVRAAIKEAISVGCGRCELEVRKSNRPAIELYQKIGYTIVQVRKSFYSDGEDAYIMELSLEGKRSDF